VSICRAWPKHTASGLELALSRAGREREPLWSQSVAAGSREFVESVQRQLGARGRYREVEQIGDVYTLREPAASI
jgi:hypothetical protein